MNPDTENKKLEKLEQIRKRIEDFIKKNTSEYQNIDKKSGNSDTGKFAEADATSPVFDDTPKTKKRKTTGMSRPTFSLAPLTTPTMSRMDRRRMPKALTLRKKRSLLLSRRPPRPTRRSRLKRKKARSLLPV